MQSNVKSHAGRNLVVMLPLIIAFSVAGCHKKDSPETIQTPPAGDAGQSPASAAPDPQNGSAPAAGALAPGVSSRAENAVRESLVGEVNPFLTGQLQIFVQQKGRLPQSFTEFVNTRLDSIPRPPAGKKWAIDSSTAEVKAVDAQ